MKNSLQNHPSLHQLFTAFLRLGLTAFGGPAMIVYIRKMAVDRRKWLDGETFKDGVVLCQSIPGATAMQAAVYVGMKTRGIPGALLSFAGFSLPAFAFMLILSSLYATFHTLPRIESLFSGLQVSVCAIVANAAWSFGRTTLKHREDFFFAAAAAVFFVIGLNPVFIIAAAALAGILFLGKTANVSEKQDKIILSRLYFRQLLMLLLPLAAGLFFLHCRDEGLFDLATLMMRIDLFAFGGGFASLPLMLHEVVDVKKWMDAKTFMDGIVLGQVTPGPIVITSTFVGYLTHRLTGALVASLAIFTPSLLMVIVLSPIMDKLKGSLLFSKATKGILASFVGLLLYVTVKFSWAVHWDIVRGVLGLAVLIALIKKADLLYVVLASAALSAVIL